MKWISSLLVSIFYFWAAQTFVCVPYFFHISDTVHSNFGSCILLSKRFEPMMKAILKSSSSLAFFVRLNIEYWLFYFRLFTTSDRLMVSHVLGAARTEVTVQTWFYSGKEIPSQRMFRVYFSKCKWHLSWITDISDLNTTLPKIVRTTGICI